MKWNVLNCIQFIHCALDPILCNNNLAKVFTQRSRHQNRTKKYCKNLNFDQICNGASTFYTASREIPWFSCWKNSSSRYSCRHAEHITHENSYFNAFFMRRLEIVKIPFGRVEWREQMELFLVAFASRFFLSSLCCCYGRRFGYKLCKTIVANEKKRIRTNGTGGFSCWIGESNIHRVNCIHALAPWSHSMVLSSFAKMFGMYAPGVCIARSSLSFHFSVICEKQALLRI